MEVPLGVVHAVLDARARFPWATPVQLHSFLHGRLHLENPQDAMRRCGVMMVRVTFRDIGEEEEGAEPTNDFVLCHESLRPLLEAQSSNVDHAQLRRDGDVVMQLRDEEYDSGGAYISLQENRDPDDCMWTNFLSCGRPATSLEVEQQVERNVGIYGQAVVMRCIEKVRAPTLWSCSPLVSHTWFQDITSYEGPEDYRVNVSKSFICRVRRRLLQNSRTKLQETLLPRWLRIKR